MNDVARALPGIECGWSEKTQPTEASFSNAVKLLEAIEGRLPPPESAGRGYWPTTRLFWGQSRIEIEVFDDRFELYDFGAEESDSQFSIEEFYDDDEQCFEQLVQAFRKILSDRTPGEG